MQKEFERPQSSLKYVLTSNANSCSIEMSRLLYARGGSTENDRKYAATNSVKVKRTSLKLNQLDLS